MTACLNKDDPTPKPKPPAQGSTARQAVMGKERQEPIAAPPPAGKSIEARVAEIAGARNPLCEAARRLLRALAEIPAKMEARGEVERLRALLEQELRDFQAICDRLNIDRKHTTAAHYALCTALDEAVSHTEWGGGNADSLGAWPSSALASTFHQDRQGGTKVFQILGRLVESVPENIGTIEVYYLILSLGFQGRYRGLADGGLQLRTLRGRLLDMLNKHYGPVPKELSPHCEPAPPGRFHHLRGIPVWMSWVLAVLVLAGMAGWYDDRRSTVVFRGDDMFGAGQAEVNAKLMPALDKVASEINKVEGKVQVIGHSDNRPFKTARFPSNQALSEERAAMVSEYLAGKGVAKGRLETIGKGDSEPITDNQTPAARAANRRVEVVVTQ